MDSKHWKVIGGVLAVLVMTVVVLQVAGITYFIMYDSDYRQVNPYTFLEQWWYYHNNLTYQKDLNVAAIVGAGVGYLLPLMTVMAVLNKKPSQFGDARFATWSDVVKMELNKTDRGLIIGRWGKSYLYYRKDAFFLLMAPSRGGKGVSFIVPNLLSWPQSVVCTDFKVENFYLTSKYRAHYGQEVYIFSPFTEDLKTHRYNPLGYVRDGHYCVPDILAVAEMLYPTDVGDSTAKYFAQLAQNLFLGLALYVKNTEGLPFTIGEVVRQSTGKGKTLKDHLTAIVEDRKDLPEACVSALNGFLAEDEQRGQKNVLSSFQAPLKDWKNPIFDAATSANDFDLRDIRKKRMSIYVAITPDYIPVAGQILNLFFSHLINLNTKELPEHNTDLKYKCLLMMDEFTAMGRSAIIAKSNNYFAGYGLQLATIVQNKAQLTAKAPEGYGEDTATTLMGNHEVQNFFTPEKEDAEEISKYLGDTTVPSKSVQRSSGSMGKTTTISDAKRPLMLPQELREMPETRQIIMMRGKKPVQCDKIRYYEDPVFMGRLKEVSPSLAALGKKMPDHDQMKAIIAAGEFMVTDVPELKLEVSENEQQQQMASPLDAIPPAPQPDPVPEETDAQPEAQAAPASYAPDF